ncbi:hypothetical protein KSS87_021076, partial [Heliosperma pusillum]
MVEFEPLILTKQGYVCGLVERALYCKCKDGDKCKICDACGMKVNGFGYHCKSKKLDFHPKCTKLENEICVQDVIFKLEKKG